MATKIGQQLCSKERRAVDQSVRGLLFYTGPLGKLICRRRDARTAASFPGIYLQAKRLAAIRSRPQDNLISEGGSEHPPEHISDAWIPRHLWPLLAIGLASGDVPTRAHEQ